MQKFHDKIICGDCMDILSRVDEPFADLVFADPPFNIGYKYDKYYDKRKRENYIGWTKDWMAVCKKILKPHGSFYIAIGDDYAAHVKLIAEELGLFLRNWIIWHYTFGQQTKNKFARSHTHIFYFVNNENNFTFNDHAIRVPSDRQLTYNDKRANPAGKMPDDVWNTYPRVCGTFRERTSWHPCQMPENLLARIITVSSNPCDCVLDPFSGSGTTAAAAFKFGRNYAGIDISKSYVEKSRKRLAELKKYNTSKNNQPLNKLEINELRRLLSDMPLGANDILGSGKVLQTFTNQFAVRINNGKKYKAEILADAIKEFGS